jgi:hypothetical protein
MVGGILGKNNSKITEKWVGEEKMRDKREQTSTVELCGEGGEIVTKICELNLKGWQEFEVEVRVRAEMRI